MKTLITYDEFAKLDLRIGKVLTCERKEGSEKLLRLTVDFGEEGTKIILSGIYPYYQPEALLNKSFVFILNLEPRKIMGEESQGMILATGIEEPILLKPLRKISPGAVVR